MAPLDRVYQEIAILKKLDHINIVKLIEVSCFSTLSYAETNLVCIATRGFFFSCSYFSQNWFKIDVQKFRLVIPSKVLLTVWDKLHSQPELWAGAQEKAAHCAARNGSELWSLKLVCRQAWEGAQVQGSSAIFIVD